MDGSENMEENPVTEDDMLCDCPLCEMSTWAHPQGGMWIVSPGREGWDLGCRGSGQGRSWAWGDGPALKVTKVMGEYTNNHRVLDVKQAEL